jgi:hypothetical protein
VSDTKPTVDGYWWTRPATDCLWRVVEISIFNGVTYIEEMGQDGVQRLPVCPWWQWLGPIASPNDCITQATQQAAVGCMKGSHA